MFLDKADDGNFALEVIEPTDEPFGGTARGAYALISAGPDGIFFSTQDGVGSPNEPIGTGDLAWPAFLERGAQAFDEFDDLRVFGGG